VIYNSIALLGFRGTGKSSVGAILAKKLGWEFVELDQLIQTKTGQSVPELTKNGSTWDKFRDIESQLLLYSLNKEKVVISCGGGVGVNDQNGNQQYKLLQSYNNCLKILLQANDQVIKERLLQDFRKLESNHRVSLRGEIETEETFWRNNLEILNKRIPLYEVQTKFIFDSSTDSVKTIADKIIMQFQYELLTANSN
jgi:shikimate kinase